MNTVPISKPPVATNRKSRAKNESKILLTMVAVDCNLAAGSPGVVEVRSVFMY